MNAIVDTRGLSCPQPVLMVLDKIKTTSAKELQVLTDSETSRENIRRAATGKGWSVAAIQEEGEEIQMTLKKV